MEYWLSVLYISLEFYAYTLGMEAFLPRRWKKSKHWLFFSAWIVVMYCMVSKLLHMYSTRNTPQCNVIQTMSFVQCSVTDLNGVTEND